jgi:hypothetical protein
MTRIVRDLFGNFLRHVIQRFDLNRASLVTSMIVRSHYHDPLPQLQPRRPRHAWRVHATAGVWVGRRTVRVHDPTTTSAKLGHMTHGAFMLLQVRIDDIIIGGGGGVLKQT